MADVMSNPATPGTEKKKKKKDKKTLGDIQVPDLIQRLQYFC
jgi:hypothetical protein